MNRNKVKIVLNTQQVRDQLLKSSNTLAFCTQKAKEAVSRLGDGYEVSQYIGKNRVNVSIDAVTEEAVKENYESNAVLKALR